MSPQSLAAVALVALFVSAPLMAPMGGSMPGDAPLAEASRATAAPQEVYESFWQNGSFGSDDHSLLRMLAHIGSLPQAPTTGIQSHVLGVAAPAEVMPALYEALALSSDAPLRDAVLAYHEALDLLSAQELAQSGQLDAASDLPIDAQVAISVLLYALTDASLLQKQAVAGLTAKEYTELVAVPGAVQAGRFDPRDETPANQAALAAVHDILSKVDGALIDEAGLLVIHATTHALPDLRKWSQREQQIKQSPDPRLDAIAGLVDAYPRESTAEMDPIDRLSILADAIVMVAGIQGIDLDQETLPLPAPDGPHPLRAAVLDLMGALGGVDATGVIVNQALDAELARADALPRSLQVAAAHIVINQAGLMRAQLDVQATDLTSGDAASLARGVREAELRVIKAVQESAPTLEAWGILWSHHGHALLPASPGDAQGKLGDAVRLGQRVTDAQAGIHDVMELAGQVNGLAISRAEAPPRPARGALGDAVLSLYARYGIIVDEDVRKDIVAGAAALPPEVEQNAARILLAQLDALGAVEDLYTIAQGNPDRAVAAADAVGRLLAGEPLAVKDVQALRDHYAAIDEAQGAMMLAAAALAAAVDASAHEIEIWAGYVAPPAREVPERAPEKPWYKKAWSAIRDFQIIGTASAQTIPGEFTPAVPCPNSPLADCDNDVWFMDPLLETVVVSGFANTDYDPAKMGKVVERTTPSDLREAAVAACQDATPDAADAACSAGQSPPSFAGIYPRGQMLSLDLGGKDIYTNNAGGSSPAFTVPPLAPPVNLFGVNVPSPFLFAHPTGVSVAVDLGGNDEYLPPREFLTDDIEGDAAGLFGAFDGFAVPGGVQGAGVEGIGILWDRRGDDRYEADQEAQGYGGGVPILQTPATQFTILIIDAPPGIGILIDGDGDDEYVASELAQGTGARGGIGILLDLAGDDGYTADDRAQGLGTVFSVGVLVDVSGDDKYLLKNDNAHGQGGGFAQWEYSGFDDASLRDKEFEPQRRGTPEGPSIGILIDGGGNDVYQGGQQGFAPTQNHKGEAQSGIAVGVLLDLGGTDEYSRPDHEGTTFEDGTCWTSFRPTGDVLNDPPFDTYNEVRQRVGTNPGDSGRGVFIDFDGGCDVDFVLPPAPDHEQFIEDRQQDASDEDGDGYPRLVEDQLGTDPENEHDYPVGVPHDLQNLVEEQDLVEEEGVPAGSPWLVRLPGLFVLGDVVVNTYPACSGQHEALEETTVELSSEEGVTSEVTAAITMPSCEYFASIDLAGDDQYYNGAGSSIDTMAKASTGGMEAPPTTLSAILLDVGGNDVYDATSRCAQGCGGFLTDLNGNDEYSVGAQGGQGVAAAAMAGAAVPDLPLVTLPAQASVTVATGVLFDATGNDVYKAHPNAIAQGSVLVESNGEGSHIAYRSGLLLDAGGGDIYDSPTQGVVAADPLIAPGDLPAVLAEYAVDAPPIGLFIDLDGADTYQPLGRQADPRTGLAAFVDAGGQDKYIGTPENRAGPDRSGHHNDWMRFEAAAGANWDVDTTVPDAGGRLGGGTSIFIDSGRDDATKLLDGSYGSGFSVGPLRTEPGSGPTGGPDRYLDDYTLLIDPAGNDQYLNNAGATRLRPGMPEGTAGAAQYDPGRNHPLASLLIDLDGDDWYETQSRVLSDEGLPEARSRGLLTQGAAFLGVAVLIDDAGNDVYIARSQSQGFSLRGVGILWDRAGDDTYSYDTALMRRPLVDAGIIAWEEFAASTDIIASQKQETVGRGVTLGWGADGAWHLKVLNTNFGDCIALDVLDGARVDGTIIQGGRIATSRFDTDSGTWNLVKSTISGCQAGLFPRVSSFSSNQINPVFATFTTLPESARILWQDDRDGTWSLYHKSMSETSGSSDTALMPHAAGNQVNPHSHGLHIVYQDDHECDAGTWRIHMVFQPTQAVDELTECGPHTSPRISDRFIVWQTQDEEERSDVAVLDRHKTQGDPDRVRIITAQLAGEHRGPVVAGHTILYTSEPEPGQFQVMRYEWTNDESLLVRGDAREPAIDASSTLMSAVWLDTLGQAGGSDAVQVYHRLVKDPPQLRGVQRAFIATVSQWLQGASTFGGAGVLFDEQGQDTYRGDAFAQGASSEGFAALVDADGNDVYRVRGPGQAAAYRTDIVAKALLLDVRGNDAYFAQHEAQGFRHASSHGSLATFLDLGGADHYQYGDGDDESLFPVALVPCPNSQSPIMSEGDIVGGCIDVAAELASILAQFNPMQPLEQGGLIKDTMDDVFETARGALDEALGHEAIGDNGDEVRQALLDALDTLAPGATVEQALADAAAAFSTAFGVLQLLCGELHEAACVGLEALETAIDEQLADFESSTVEAVDSAMVDVVESIESSELLFGAGQQAHEILDEIEAILDGAREIVLNNWPAGVLMEILGIMAQAQANAEDEADLQTGPFERNNALWVQPAMWVPHELIGPAPIGPTAIGSMGIDAPFFETANRALRELVEEAIQVSVEVHDEDGNPVGGEANPVAGPASMVAVVEVEDNDFSIERVEYLNGIGSALTFRGYADNQKEPDEDGSVLRYKRAWDTTSGAYPDGEYTVQVRVHYRYGVVGTSTAALGYVEGDAQVKLDNVPRIMNLVIANTTFSPFPFSDDDGIPGHVEYSFSVPDDPFLEGLEDRHAWVRVQILDDDDVIHEIITDVKGGLQRTWDGHDVQGNVQSGTYTARISVTDRDPGDWGAPERTVQTEFPVNVRAGTPTAGCIRFIQGNDVGACNAGATVNLENSQGQAGQPVQFTLRLDMEADEGIGDRKYHVFLGEPAGDSIEWHLDRTIERSIGPAQTTLTIADGETRHVLVLGEDEVGNLECMPACGGMASDDVQRGGTPIEIADALTASLLRKLDWSDGTFPAGPEAGQPVFANFTADLLKPVIREVAFVLDGIRWAGGINDGPRLNGTSNLTLSYVMFDEADRPPEPRVEWRNPQVTDQQSARRSFTLDDAEMGRQPDDEEDFTHHVSWDGWADLVADWPDGRIRVEFGGHDAAGNTPFQTFTGNLILDRVAPTMAARVEYPAGQFHVETGQTVQVFVTGSDPMVENAPRDQKLAWSIDPSNVTSLEPGANCVLRFDCTRGEERFAVVPINESFGRPQVVNVVVTVRDTAGNPNQTLVAIQVGAPRLDPAVILELEKVGVFEFDTAWSTPVPTNAALEYWTGTANSDSSFVYSNTSARHHTFNLTDLLAGTQYSYRVLVENATDPAGKQLSAVHAFRTKFGVNLDVKGPAGGAVLSGLYTVHGLAGILADQAIEPRVTMRIHGPGLPPIGRVVFDGTTNGGEFTLDFVTQALDDGIYELNVTASHLGESVYVLLTDLLVDNEAPELVLVEPAEGTITNTLPARILVRVREAANPVDVEGALLIIDGKPVTAVDREYIPDDAAAQDGVLRFTVTHPAALDPAQLGPRNLEVIVGDLAGNLGRASTRFVFDPQAPSVSNAEIVYPDGQHAARPGQWITVRVEASDNHTGVARIVANLTGLDGIGDAALARGGTGYSVQARVPATQEGGLLNIPIQVLDHAGNARAAVASLVVDATPPTIEDVRFTETGAASGSVRVGSSEPVTATLRIPGLATLTSLDEADNHTFTVSALIPGKTYMVNVTLQDAAGHQASTEATWRFLPDLGEAPPVHNLTALTGLGVARLDWDAPLQGFRYVIHRAQNGTFELLATVAERHYVDASVVPGDSYRYFVQGVDAADRPGRASAVVMVTIPEEPEVTRLEAVDVRPRTGLADDTVFVFTASLAGAQQADPPAWLILDNGARRMNVAEGEDCRITCTLEHATRLPAITMQDAAPRYHVEIDDATQFLRMPETGALAGPTVFSTGSGPASSEDTEKTTPLPLLSMLAALGAALMLRRYR